MFVSRKRVFVLAALGFAFCFPLGWTLASQKLRTREPSAPVSTAMEKGPHFGEPEETVVAVEVTNLASRISRRASGLILRCDGFVLCPSSLFALREGEKRADEFQVTVVHRPGTARESRMAGRVPRFMPRDLGYAVFKVDDVHLPAARISLPDGIEPGDSLETLVLPRDAAGQRYLPIIRRRLTVAESQNPPESLVNGDVRLAPLDLPISAGSVLLNPDRRVIGMIAEDGKPAAFLSFEILTQATNCVAPSPWKPKPAPIDCSIDLQEPEAKGGDGGGMVAIPGGPVRMPFSLTTEQPDMESAAVACVGEFEIDRFEVTNEQYLAFRNSLPGADRKNKVVRQKLYPLSWAEENAPFPGMIKDLPVLGVSMRGAAAYARWFGKRLPTPYEWSRAAFGDKGEEARPDWMKRYIADRQETWASVRDAHVKFLAANGPLFENELNPPKDPRRSTRKMVSPFIIPWIVTQEVSMGASIFSRNLIDAAADGLRGRWTDPQKVLAVGSRTYDRSPFGVMDMTLNANELFVPWPGRERGGEDRHFQTAWTAAKIPLNDRWMPCFFSAPGQAVRFAPGQDPFYRPQVSVLGADKLLSRLLYRYEQMPHLGQVTLEALTLGLNLTNAVTLLWPLEGRTTQVGWNLSVPGGAAGFWREGLKQDLPAPPGYRAWAGPPRGFSREIGRDIPGLTPTKWAYRQHGTSYSFKGESHEDYGFLTPVGFRCAR